MIRHRSDRCGNEAAARRARASLRPGWPDGIFGKQRTTIFLERSDAGKAEPRLTHTPPTRKLIDAAALEGNGMALVAKVNATTDGKAFQRLDEGERISGRFSRNIGIDQPTKVAGDGKGHAQIWVGRADSSSW